MPKFKICINRRKISAILCFALAIMLIITVPVTAAQFNNKSDAKGDELSVLTLWQIDSFEGGKGSRANYLQNIANEFSEVSGCYITVKSLSADAARMNLKNGNIPDLISYGAGMFGIESYISGNKPYYNWCRGGYCYLSTDTNADFEDITAENLIINSGTGNLVSATALFCGVDGAKSEKPTSAYVKLLNGEYKYLLGTQRDIYRLKTRGVPYVLKPVTEFNDLYQNISVICKNTQKKEYAERFINFLLKNSDSLTKLGLFADGQILYDDDLHILEEINFDVCLTLPISESTKIEIDKAIINNDVKLLKNLLN